jgi:T-complex protein 1 subunit epsilon
VIFLSNLAGLSFGENSGLDPIRTLPETKASQVAEKNHAIGVNCSDNAQTNDMKKQMVIESLHSKKSQILLATQLVKMILKIDDVRDLGGAQ